MIEKIYSTNCGNIHYWTSDNIDGSKLTICFLPGLTADHRLFEKQIPCFEGKYNVFVWDAPGHNLSRPFQFGFDLMDKARWLHEIWEKEKIDQYVVVGQSMGGYVAQGYLQQYPGKMKGFVSIDSAPLQKQYVTNIEIWMLKRTEWMYRMYPWKLLLSQGSKGCAESEYGRKLMEQMMNVYTGDQNYYARLSGHGFGMLAKAMEADLPYKIDCPALLICGTKDQAGAAKNYNRRWHQKTGIPIAWIENAGHNANTDQPDQINQLIEEFVETL